jgi:tRNA pseudouridine13 synthase
VLAELTRTGVPAFFGEQRFGRGGATLARARAWIVEGGRGPRAPFERKLLVSALQSSIFNTICAERMRTIGLAGVLDGDLVRKEESGGLFVATDLDEVRGRAERFEVTATGPMFGAEMRWPEREAKAMEEAALAAAGLDGAKLAGFRRAGEGTRRPLRFKLADARVSADEDGLVLSFLLPAGAYATIVLRELTRDAAA